jgi:hypothetical protein
LICLVKGIKFQLMHKILDKLWLIAFACGALCGSAQAQSDDCNAIKDADKLNYCKATTSGKSDFCNKISSNDTRNLCLAKIHNQARYCNSISTARVKERCLQSIR